MPILNSIAKISDQMTEWRRYLHTIPELSYKEFKTSKFISSKLKEWNIEHETGIAKTGIVAKIKGNKGNKGTKGNKCNKGNKRYYHYICWPRM